MMASPYIGLFFDEKLPSALDLFLNFVRFL